jgi:nitrate reductase gamma subunit
MDWFSYLVAGIMVYVAVAVFFLGMGYQVYQWLNAPKSAVRTGYFPKPGSLPAKWLKTGEDSFLFPQVIRFDRGMWFFTLLFHFGLLGAFIGHLRLLQEFTPLVQALGAKGMDRFALWSGGIMGVLLWIGLIYYILRRVVHPYRKLSLPEDYFLLFLLFLAVLFGNQMRFLGDVHTADYRAYFQSLLSLKPAFPPALVSSSSRWAMDFHILFANLTLIFFPFSKLVHVIATFPANLAKRA